MTKFKRIAGTLFCLGAVILGWLPSSLLAQDEAPASVLFRSVRVFDGEQLLEPVDVLVRDGIIEAIGDDIALPEGADSIDGGGKTLLPGLVDCHVHAFFPAHLEQAAVFGVTTVLDMMSMPMAAARMRSAREEGTYPQRADYYSAGAAVTVKDGHGTQFGFPVPVLDGAAAAEAFIADRVREGSDYIKIIYDNGNSFGIDRPTLTPEMFEAAVAAARAAERMAVAHIGSGAGAGLAVDYGIDGLVHLFADEKISDELLQQMAEQNVFVIPTTVVIQNITGPVTVATLINDEHIGPMLLSADRTGLARTFPSREDATNTTDNLYYNIAALEAAGVKVLAGTDAPNPGTAHGASMHHELELLIAAGLTNAQALAAATSRAADCFGLDDRGRIAIGKRADLLLVNGNPIDDIKATRDIVGVWKAGHAIDRETRRQRAAKAQEDAQEEQAKDDKADK